MLELVKVGEGRRGMVKPTIGWLRAGGLAVLVTVEKTDNWMKIERESFNPNKESSSVRNRSLAMD